MTTNDDTVQDQAIDLTEDKAAAAHALVNIAEDLARYLRVVTNGNLTIGILDSRGRTLRERNGIGWGDAHEALDGWLHLTSTRREVLAVQAAILRGQGEAGAHLDAVAPARVWDDPRSGMDRQAAVDNGIVG